MKKKKPIIFAALVVAAIVVIAVILQSSNWSNLHISEDTKLLDMDGSTISVEDLKPGYKVKVTLKDSFTEETPYYYPIVYEIVLIDVNP